LTTNIIGIENQNELPLALASGRKGRLQIGFSHIMWYTEKIDVNCVPCQMITLIILLISIPKISTTFTITLYFPDFLYS